MAGFEPVHLICEACRKSHPDAFPGGLTPHVLVYHQGSHRVVSKQCVNCGALVAFGD